MYSITIISNDRVVTAGRVNAGKESLDGLSVCQVDAVMAGKAVHIKSKLGNSAVVEIQVEREMWRHSGAHSSLPQLANMASNEERQAALLEWADRSQVTALLP